MSEWEKEDGYIKLCECGCGNLTPIAKMTARRLGHVKGQAVRFIQNHHWKGKHHKEESKEKVRQAKWGEKNGMWKGENITEETGRQRARFRYELCECILCGEEATDRHHRDGNTANNDPLNVQVLCRHCHMVIDGRMKNLDRTGCIPWNKGGGNVQMESSL